MMNLSLERKCYADILLHRTMLHVLLHLAGAANFAYCLYGDAYILANIPDELRPNRQKMGGTLKYITYWNVWLHLIFYLLSLVNDFFGTNATERRSSSLLQSACDHLFASLAFPVGISITVMYWVSIVNGLVRVMT